jgi:hypothetical protein
MPFVGRAWGRAARLPAAENCLLGTGLLGPPDGQAQVVPAPRRGAVASAREAGMAAGVVPKPERLQPREGAAGTSMLWTAAGDLVGKPVLNGCGALLGEVVRVLGDADGEVREIVVRQRDAAKDWFVDACFIKHVADAIILKGPREGFHIAPLPEPGVAAAPAAALDGPALAASSR